MDEQYLTWVYAVIPDGTGRLPEPVHGVAGEPVRVLSHAGVAAVVGSVRRAGFGREPLQERLRSPALLERAVRDHHRVVTACFRSVPTVPFRLATAYLDDSGVRESLERRRTRLLEALEMVAGRAEWGAQAYPAAAPAAPERVPEPVPAGRPGTGYLLRRRAEQAARERARVQAYASAGAVHAELQQLAAATRVQPPAGSRPGQPGPVLLDTAYLMDQAVRGDLLDLVRGLPDRYPDLRLRLTGPWPAYSFVDAGEVGT